MRSAGPGAVAFDAPSSRITSGGSYGTPSGQAVSGCPAGRRVSRSGIRLRLRVGKPDIAQDARFAERSRRPRTLQMCSRHRAERSCRRGGDQWSPDERPATHCQTSLRTKPDRERMCGFLVGAALYEYRDLTLRPLPAVSARMFAATSPRALPTEPCINAQGNGECRTRPRNPAPQGDPGGSRRAGATVALASPGIAQRAVLTAQRAAIGVGRSARIRR